MEQEKEAIRELYQQLANAELTGQYARKRKKLIWFWEGIIMAAWVAIELAILQNHKGDELNIAHWMCIPFLGLIIQILIPVIVRRQKPSETDLYQMSRLLMEKSINDMADIIRHDEIKNQDEDEKTSQMRENAVIIQQILLGI